MINTEKERAKSAKRIQKAVDALRSYDPDRIYIFGSYARDENDELSDLDLIIIKETRAPFFERLKEASRNLPREIGKVDLFVYTPAEFLNMQKDGNAFAQTVLEEGRLVYERRPKH